jgi:hypothetical protein
MNTTVKICIGTYRRMNEGNTGGKWLSLPMPEKSLISALNAVAGREHDPEFAILDSECSEDFRAIKEAENIVLLNREISQTKKETSKAAKGEKSPAVKIAFAEYEKIWGKCADMIEFCQKKLSDAFMTESGYVVVFEKPGIENNFCFSTGYNGRAEEEMSKSAYNMARNVSRTKDYFIRENMEKAFREYAKPLDNDTAYAQKHHCSTLENTRFCYLIEPHYTRYATDQSDILVLTESDKSGLLAMIESEKAKFAKRLETWWKRYGADGLHTWTYLSD